MKLFPAYVFMYWWYVAVCRSYTYDQRNRFFGWFCISKVYDRSVVWSINMFRDCQYCWNSYN